MNAEAREFPAVPTATDVVVLGKIVDAHGLRGELKVHPFADDPGAWGGMRWWWLGREEDAPTAWRRYRLVRCHAQGAFLVATLANVLDRDTAESFKGCLVGAPRGDLPETGDGEYYWADLLGLKVVNLQGEELGSVLGLIETAANDVLRVGEGEVGGAERLLPFVASVVLEVDVPGRCIRVDWGADW